MIYTHAPYRIDVDVEKTRAFSGMRPFMTVNVPGAGISLGLCQSCPP